MNNYKYCWMLLSALLNSNIFGGINNIINADKGFARYMANLTGLNVRNFHNMPAHDQQDLGLWTLKKAAWWEVKRTKLNPFKVYKDFQKFMWYKSRPQWIKNNKGKVSLYAAGLVASLYAMKKLGSYVYSKLHKDSVWQQEVKNAEIEISNPLDMNVIFSQDIINFNNKLVELIKHDKSYLGSFNKKITNNYYVLQAQYSEDRHSFVHKVAKDLGYKIAFIDYSYFELFKKDIAISNIKKILEQQNIVIFIDGIDQVDKSVFEYLAPLILKSKNIIIFGTGFESYDTKLFGLSYQNIILNLLENNQFSIIIDDYFNSKIVQKTLGKAKYQEFKKLLSPAILDNLKAMFINKSYYSISLSLYNMVLNFKNTGKLDYIDVEAINKNEYEKINN